MRKNLQWISLLRSLSTGVLSPVLPLLVLAHGATLPTLSLIIGAYSFTVIAAEFPSGVFADLYGRKLSFVVSSVFMLAGYTLALFSYSFELMLVSMVLNGLGRAFASGSIDALALDEAADDAMLVKVTSRLSILESVGLAAGALAGGLLAGIGSTYTGNLIACLVLVSIMLVVTLFTVRESPQFLAAREANHRPPPLNAHLRESLGFLRRGGTVRVLLVFTLITGFTLLSVETYWQADFTTFSNTSWALGAVSCLGFAAVILGSKWIEHRLARAPRAGIRILLLQKALMALFLFGLWMAGGTVAFVGSYALFYLFLGGASVAESTLLNREAPSAQRASILSLFSFLLQIGGLLASLCGYWVTAQMGFRIMWPIAGTLLLICAGIFTSLAVFSRKQQPASASDAPELTNKTM